jgi:D-inositol-3-phosphate glycosyltransferase
MSCHSCGVGARVSARADLLVALLTGGDDPNYAVPLAAALADRRVRVDFIGNDDMAGASDLERPNIRYLNLRGNQDRGAAAATKVARIARYYARLVTYALRSDARLFHILWLNKFEVLDRTVLNAFYRLTGKKLVFTAHNVNAGKRDGRDTRLNRASLRAMYALCDHIFVHTEPAREELVRDFGVAPGRITVIPFGLNTYVPNTPLSKVEARVRLGVGETGRLLLFFGQIAPYKGLDVLIDAMALVDGDSECRLVVAGRAKRGFESYWAGARARAEALGSRVALLDRFIDDREVPLLFRAADALVLPYREIYQSGPMSLAHRFGVPVIATRVGSFASEVIPGVTGMLCEPDNPADLAGAIRTFFASDLYLGAEQTQKRIQEIAQERYSWERVSQEIVDVYARL